MVFLKQKISLVIAVIGFFIITVAGIYHLSESPGIWFDEGMYTQVAMNLATYGTEGIQTAPGELVSAGSVTGGYPFIAPIAFSYKVFGVGVIQGRTVMVLFIFAFAVVSFFFIRKLFGIWYASITLALLSSFAMLYGNGKSVLGEVPGLFFLMCALLALLFFERRNYEGPLGAMAVGLFTGLCVVTKPIFILLLPAFALAWLIRHKEVRVRIREFCFGVVTFSIPFAVWLYFQFGAGDTLANFLSFYANPYGVPDLGALLASNFTRFFTDTTALYTLILMGVWSVTFLLRSKKKEYVSMAEFSAFLFCIIILLASLRLPGWNRYIFPATAIGLVFFSHSFLCIFNRARERISFLARVPWVPYVLLFFMFVGQMYQVGFSSYVADYYKAHRTHDVGEALSALGSSASIFVYNAPEVVVLLPSSNYYQFIKPYADNDEAVAGASQLSMLEEGVADYVIVGTGEYAPENSIFAPYHFLKTVNRYTLLNKP